MSQTEGPTGHHLRNLWYFALHAHSVKAGQVRHMQILGEPIVFGRTRAGEPFALRDLCPHRGVPLSKGRMVDDTVECPYHGWRFGPSAQCTLIPSLVGEEGIDPGRIHVRKYHLHETNGLIWIYMPEEGRNEPPASAPAAAAAAPAVATASADTEEALCSTGDEEEPCTLRFCNQRQGVTARVLWVDYEGEEREYARLDELVGAALVLG